MNGPDAHLLDAYLDGLLSADARSTFQSHLQHDAGLRRQIELQRMIDSAMRRLWAPPELQDTLNESLAALLGAKSMNQDAAVKLRKPNRLRIALNIAAAVAIAAVALYRLTGFLNTPPQDGRYFRAEQKAMDTIYNEKLATGFVPEWKCEDDKEFTRTFEHQLFQPLVMMTPPPGLAMGGLGYCNVLSPYSMFMLAHVHNDKVIVFFDRLDADKELPPLSDPRLRRFRRELGELVLYEVTPLDEPQFLHLFETPPQG
jgi:hypothetical protein